MELENIPEPAVRTAYTDGIYNYTYGCAINCWGDSTFINGQHGWGVRLKDL